jgi:late competence protein required for DNA uptake (superfamily II DNA/RNA helicase)
MLIFSIKGEEWDVIISLSSYITILIGIVIAVRNLKIIAKSQKLEVINNFINELKTNEEARKFLFQKFQFTSLDKMNVKSINEIEKVINSLNRISLLLDNKLVEAEIIFGLCHTMIIRCEYQLKEFIKQKEIAIGGRYGRRITKLTERAKKFHDSKKYHRYNPINIYSLNNNPVEVYKTILGNTFEEKLNNHLEWFWRRLWKKF